MRKRIYIDDFCEDLNYRGVILYIGNVDPEKLAKALQNVVNKCYRLAGAVADSNPTRKNLIYVENCDLQILDYPLYEYLEEGYDVYILHEDAGKYYVKSKL